MTALCSTPSGETRSGQEYPHVGIVSQHEHSLHKGVPWCETVFASAV